MLRNAKKSDFNQQRSFSPINTQTTRKTGTFLLSIFGLFVIFVVKTNLFANFMAPCVELIDAYGASCHLERM